MQTFNLDLSVKRVIPLLYVKQRDVGVKIAVNITDNGTEYAIPADVSFSVWYSGKSGEGNYTEIGDKSAFSVEGNTVTVELIYQMLNNPGEHMMCLVMNDADGKQRGLWNIPYFVEAIPGADSEAAQAYYQAFLKAQEKSEEAADRAEKAAAQTEIDQEYINEQIFAAGQAANNAINAAGAAEEAARRAEEGAKLVNPDILAQMQKLLEEAEILSETAIAAAKQAEEAAAKLEGGFVLKKGDGADSIVQAVTEPSGAGDDPTPKALSRGAVALGRHTEAGFVDAEGNDVGKEAMAVNYDTKAPGRGAFAANISTTASKKGAASFGGSNTVDGEFAFCGGGLGNHTDADKSFVTGDGNNITEEAVAGFAANSGNTVTAPNAGSVGYGNNSKAEEAFTIGGENEASAKRGLATGNRTKCRGAFGFTGGTSTEVTKDAGAGVALGGYTITKAPYGYTGGAYSETSGVGGFTHGLHLIGTEQCQAVFGKCNAPAKDILFMIGNGTTEVVNEKTVVKERKNAFAVKERSIVIDGIELTADTVANIATKSYIEEYIKNLGVAEGAVF